MAILHRPWFCCYQLYDLACAYSICDVLPLIADITNVSSEIEALKLALKLQFKWAEA